MKHYSSGLLRICLLAVSCLGLTGYALLWRGLLQQRLLQESEGVVLAEGGCGEGNDGRALRATTDETTIGRLLFDGDKQNNDLSKNVKIPCSEGDGGSGPSALQRAHSADGSPAVVSASGIGDANRIGGGGGDDAFPHNKDYAVLIGCDRVCQSADGGGELPLLLITLVSSLAESRERRDAARRTWASVQSHRGHALRTVFVVGRAADAASQAIVDAESAAWGDLLQLDFVDSYRNLTLKTVLGLRYVLLSAACRRAMFVMKTDDDVVVLYSNLADHLLTLRVSEARLLYTGSVRRNSRPVRDPLDKWHVGFVEYPGDFYPPYAGGSGYVLSAAAVELVLSAAARLPYLSMEDAFVGVCAARARLRPSHHDAFQGYWLLWTACRARALFTSHDWQPDELDDAWQLVIDSTGVGRTYDNGGEGSENAPAEAAGANSKGDSPECPPLDWLTTYYEYADDEVWQKYQAAVDAASRPQKDGEGDGDTTAIAVYAAAAAELGGTTTEVTRTGGGADSNDRGAVQVPADGRTSAPEWAAGGDSEAERWPALAEKAEGSAVGTWTPAALATA